MRIAVDAMGGDHAPREIVRGAVDYAAKSTDEMETLRRQMKEMQDKLDRMAKEADKS